MRWKMAEKVQSKNGDSQPMHCTSLRAGLGVLHDPSTSNLLPAYSIGLEFVKDVPFEWILNCRLPPGLRVESLKQLYKTSSYFLQADYIDYLQQTAVFQRPGCSLYSGIAMDARGRHRAGSNESSRWRPSGVVDERCLGIA